MRIKRREKLKIIGRGEKDEKKKEAKKKRERTI